jgi:hypothetical protein
VSDDEEDEDEDEDEDGEDDDEEEDDGDVRMEEPSQLVSPSKRKQKIEEETDSGVPSPPSEAMAEDDEEESGALASTVDDGLPYPRVRSAPEFLRLGITKNLPSCFLRNILLMCPSPSNLSGSSSCAPPPNGKRSC